MALDVLFVHNNFPGQYGHLSQALAGLPGVRVHSISSSAKETPRLVNAMRYAKPDGDVSRTHPFARRFDSESRRAEQVTYALSTLKAEGRTPRLVFAHPGWGETLPLRTVLPDAAIVLYCEFFYRARGADVGFDPEFPALGVDGATRVSLRNASTLLGLADCDIGVAPTSWQRSVFPSEFHPKIEVIHDGIDLDDLDRPYAGAHPLSGRGIPVDAKIVTYVSRSLEPYRGFHVFMRALPDFQRACPDAHVVLLGAENDVSYGTPPTEAASWKDAMLNELRGRIDLSRVHFLGSLSFDRYLAVMRRSDLHVYLTYPFVLSWSLIEAMALGRLIIGSRTGPLDGVIKHGETGLLTPFFDVRALSALMTQAVLDAPRFQPIARNARETARRLYDFRTTIWPRYRALIERLGVKLGAG
jgi:glycosyltransferase involved in cell wall biosynthesis